MDLETIMTSHGRVLLGRLIENVSHRLSEAQDIILKGRGSIIHIKRILHVNVIQLP